MAKSVDEILCSQLWYLILAVQRYREQKYYELSYKNATGVISDSECSELISENKNDVRNYYNSLFNNELKKFGLDRSKDSFQRVFDFQITDQIARSSLEERYPFLVEQLVGHNYYTAKEIYMKEHNLENEEESI